MQNVCITAEKELLNTPDFDTLTYIKKAQNGDSKAKDLIVDKYLGLIYKIAKKYRNIKYCEFEDLINIGVLGFINAINTFNCNKQVKFITYASRCVINEFIKVYHLNNDNIDSVSFEMPIGKEKFDNPITYEDILEDEKQINELNSIENDFDLKILVKNIKRNIKIDNFNWEIFKLYYGLNNNERFSFKSICEQYKLTDKQLHRIINGTMYKVRAYCLKSFYKNERTNTSVF